MENKSTRKELRDAHKKIEINTNIRLKDNNIFLLKIKKEIIMKGKFITKNSLKNIGLPKNEYGLNMPCKN